jgi:hypothetical protein
MWRSGAHKTSNLVFEFVKDRIEWQRAMPGAEPLLPELEAKLAFRGRTRDAMTAELATKEARYKKLWAVRLGQKMATLPPFDDVFRAVRRSLRDAGLVER